MTMEIKKNFIFTDPKNRDLNIGYFQLFKHWHIEKMNKTMKFGQTEFTKFDFFDFSPQMHKKTFTAKTIFSM